MAGRLEGKVALISGTGGRMGRVAARIFTAEGAKVVGCDVAEEAEAETAELLADVDYVSAGAVDLSKREGADRWVRTALDAFGKVDVLYNNAGAAAFAPFATPSDDDWDVCVFGEMYPVWESCKAAWSALTETEGAAIVNIASLAAIKGSRTMPHAAHSAAKGAVVALTRQLAAEGAAVGIRVNCISPGTVRSPATEAILAAGDDSPLAAMVAASAEQRLGEPEEIVKAALFLASADATFVNGVNLPVDGGASVIG